MKAAHVVRRGPPADAIEIADVSRPDPGPDEVRVRVEACALNRLDVFTRVGHPDREDAFPHQSGGDVAGVVDAVGEAVTDWSPGDEVVVYPGVTCGDCEFCDRGEETMCADYRIVGEDLPGGLAEYLVVPASILDSKPSSVDFVTAAAWPVAFTTAWRMLVSVGGLRPAETALVPGASGGVASAALQITDLVGAQVLATTSTPEKAEWAGRWADAVIDYTRADVVERVHEETDGRGVDLVAEHVGEAAWQQHVDCLATGGRMVVCGATTGARPDFDVRTLYQRHRQILGAPMGNRREFRAVSRLVAAGDLDPQVHAVLDLADTAEAHRLVESGDALGKVVVTP